MKRICVLSTLMLVLASGLLISCETPDMEQKQEFKKVLGDETGGLPVKPSPPKKNNNY